MAAIYAQPLLPIPIETLVRLMLSASCCPPHAVRLMLSAPSMPYTGKTYNLPAQLPHR